MSFFSFILTVLILNRGLNTTPANELGKTQVIEIKDGKRFVNGVPIGFGPGETNVAPVGKIAELPDGKISTGPLGPLAFISTISRSKIEITTAKKGENGKVPWSDIFSHDNFGSRHFHEAAEKAPAVFVC